MNNKTYQDFIKENPSKGYLKIRAFSANEAIPVEGVKIVVSHMIDDEKIIFFEGKTNESGIIDKIALPAPQLNPDNMEKPQNTKYDVEATYAKENLKALYIVNMYEDICVMQNINVKPEIKVGES